MKCIILLSFVALCYSLPHGTGYGSRYGYGYGLQGFGGILGSGKTFNVNQDGSVTITTTNGKIMTISKVPGQNNVVVTATEPTGNQVYQYGYQKYQPTQADILAQILTQYQGDVTQNAFQQLLGDVNSAVQSGQLNNDVYQVLQNLNQLQGQTQGVYTGYPFQNQVYGGVQAGQMAQQLQELEQAQQIQQLVQQQQYQHGVPVYVAQQNQYPYGQQVVVPVGVNEQGQIVEKVMLQTGYTPNVIGTGINSWKALINSILYGNTQQQQVGQYGQYYPYGSYGQYTTGQLGQVAGLEKVILNQQNQIHQEQIQQQQQQQQLQQQQLQQQLQQQQQQNQQQYVQDVQEQVQKEQEQVLQQQQQLQQQMQQQQQYNTVQNLFGQTKGQQIFSQQKPGFYSQGGLFGAYGQGIHGYNVPLVF